MVLFLIIILIVIIGGGFLIFKILKNKKRIKSSFSVKDIIKPTDSSLDEDIEVLDVYSEDEKINDVSNNFDLDDLFKTISMSAVDNSEFDFGLRRGDKK